MLENSKAECKGKASVGGGNIVRFNLTVQSRECGPKNSIPFSFVCSELSVLPTYTNHSFYKELSH